MVTRQGIDSKALLATLLRSICKLFLCAAAGAALGYIIYFGIALYNFANAQLCAEAEYYIDFAECRYEAKDYYNAYTWDDVVETDLILGRMMDELGDGYDRAEVADMLDADIWSDVRYLTITVTGSDEERVLAVSAAFEGAIAEFASSMDEFDAIYKIDDNGIAKERVEFFSWKAAFLGAAVFLVIAIFIISFVFMVGDRFFTKMDINKFLDIPTLGLCYKDTGGYGKGLDAQEERLIDNLGELALGNEGEYIYLLDCSDGKEAEQFIERLSHIGIGYDINTFRVYDSKAYAGDGAVIVLVPFAKSIRERMTDEINNAALHGVKASGAVLTECDREWVRLYYGRSR